MCMSSPKDKHNQNNQDKQTRIDGMMIGCLWLGNVKLRGNEVGQSSEK